MPERTIAFRNRRTLRLAATWIGPTRGQLPVVVFAHDRGRDRRDAFHRELARGLGDLGFACLLLDLTGCGASDGTPGEATVDRHAEDLQAALDWLSGQWDFAPGAFGLHGTGTGAGAAVLAAAADPRFDALVLESPWGPPEALEAAARVRAPTLILQGADDPERAVFSRSLSNTLGGERLLDVVPNAGRHLAGSEAGRHQAYHAAADWFVAKIGSATIAR